MRRANQAGGQVKSDLLMGRPMDINKWRVGKIVVGAWAVWPPSWPTAKPPLLAFSNWPQAFRAAADRADFAHSPPPPRGFTDA